MTMMPFDLLFEEIAHREIRTLRPVKHDRLPDRTFALMEWYCVEPGCDCRRVILKVIEDAEDGRHVATINYAFEPPEPPLDDEGRIFLDPLNPQSKLAPVLLEMVAEMIERDRDYHDRLVRHYEMWKRAIDDPDHPAHKVIRSAGERSAAPWPKTYRRTQPKVGPNEPCPCGSGRKYKKCCRE
jgi:hypothetical protein